MIHGGTTACCFPDKCELSSLHYGNDRTALEPLLKTEEAAVLCPKEILLCESFMGYLYLKEDISFTLMVFPVK